MDYEGISDLEIRLRATVESKMDHSSLGVDVKLHKEIPEFLRRWRFANHASSQPLEYSTC